MLSAAKNWLGRDLQPSFNLSLQHLTSTGYKVQLLPHRAYLRRCFRLFELARLALFLYNLRWTLAPTPPITPHVLRR